MININNPFEFQINPAPKPNDKKRRRDLDQTVQEVVLKKPQPEQEIFDSFASLQPVPDSNKAWETGPEV